ncbi:MAG: hypothetical protein U1F25_15975 [Rubrivivax sp.]
MGTPRSTPRPGGARRAAQLATPLPHADAARLPLAVLPPNRVRVLNAAQALQVLLTLLLTGSDWCARIGEVAALLPAHSQRIDFNLQAAIAPRLLAAQSEGRDATRALEDAWARERVQRRWQHLAGARRSGARSSCNGWPARAAGAAR